MWFLRNSRGASLIELLIQMVIILAVAPVIVCCLTQGLTTVAAVVIPWTALVLIVIGVGACLAAVLASYRGAPRDYGPPPGGGVPLLPPVRRPPGIPGPNGNGRERREH